MSDEKTRTIKRVISHHDGRVLKVPVLMGLKWASVVSKGFDGQVAKLADDLAAKSFTSVKTLSDNGSAVGFYVPRPIEEGIPLPKGCVSAAAVFAETVGKNNPDAALVLTLPDEQVYIVQLHDGTPVIDQVDAKEMAASTVGDVAVVYADDDVRFGGCVKIDLGWLIDAASHSRQSSMRKVPVNPKTVISLMLILSLLVAGGVGATLYMQKKEQERKEREAAAARAAAPGPKYTKALMAARASMMRPASEWARVYDGVMQTRVAVPGGWIRRKILCTPTGCSSNWERQGGTNEELAKALAAAPVQEMVAPVIPAQMDAAVTVAQLFPQASAYTGQLPSFKEWLDTNTSVIQNWRTAKFTTRIGDVELWPKVPEVPTSYRGPDTLGMAAIALTMPGSFMKEVLAQTPPEVSWNSAEFELRKDGDAKDRVSVTMTGVVYVSLQK